MVLKILGSNLTIKDKTVRIDAKNAFIFLKQAETRVTEGKTWLEPQNSLQQQGNQAFLQKQSDMERESILCSNLKQNITPELSFQIKTLKKHLSRDSA
jgi:hypothetical protein